MQKSSKYNNSGQIIALGGGGFSDQPDNLLLDEYILLQTNKAKPKILFLPTAGGDHPGGIVLEHHEARVRALLRQVVGAADPGNAGADDQDVEMLGALFGLGCRCLRPGHGLVHRLALCWSLDGSLEKLLDRSLNSSIELSIGPPSKTK